MAWNRHYIDEINIVLARIKEAIDMRSGFTSGMLIGGIVGATVSMIANHDIDMNKMRRRMMRMGRSVYRKSRRIVSGLADMMQ